MDLGVEQVEHCLSLLMEEQGSVMSDCQVEVTGSVPLMIFPLLSQVGLLGLML